MALSPPQLTMNIIRSAASALAQAHVTEVQARVAFGRMLTEVGWSSLPTLAIPMWLALWRLYASDERTEDNLLCLFISWIPAPVRSKPAPPIIYAG